MQPKTLYKSFDGKLDAGTPSGIEITLTQNNKIKVCVCSAFTDRQDWAYYLNPSDMYNEGTDWTAPANAAGTLYWQMLLHDIQEGGDYVYYRRAAIK